MQSTNIIAYRGNGFFGIPIIGKTNTFAIKFDTGAAHTVISIGKFKGFISDKLISKAKDYLIENNYQPQKFLSATGNAFVGYPAHIDNIVIGNYKFPKFYYYIVIDRLFNNKQIAILGDNFIDCCDFSHKAHGNILISGFDFDAYAHESHSISTDEILDIVQ